MKKLDDQEQNILRELIRNPRISDNQIGKNTGIPVKTVNRKRKLLEQNNILNYFTFVNHGSHGTEQFNSQYLYLIKLNFGITALQVTEKFPYLMTNPILTKHTLFSGVGEDNGHVIITIILESVKHNDIIEIFNADIVPSLGNYFGPNCIVDVKTIPMRRSVKLLHNYIPGFNMENGVIKKDWPNENLFI